MSGLYNFITISGKSGEIHRLLEATLDEANNDFKLDTLFPLQLDGLTEEEVNSKKDERWGYRWAILEAFKTASIDEHGNMSAEMMLITREMIWEWVKEVSKQFPDMVFDYYVRGDSATIGIDFQNGKVIRFYMNQAISESVYAHEQDYHEDPEMFEKLFHTHRISWDPELDPYIKHLSFPNLLLEFYVALSTKVGRTAGYIDRKMPGSKNAVIYANPTDKINELGYTTLDFPEPVTYVCNDDKKTMHMRFYKPEDDELFVKEDWDW